VSAEKLFTTQAGITWSMDWDGEGDCTVLSSQDCTDIIDANRALANHDQGPWRGEGDEFRLVRRIPFNLITQWENELGIDFYDENAAKEVMSLLNSNEYSALRTWDGTI